MKYAEKYGVSRAGRKCGKRRPYIYPWKARWDGTAQSLACQSRRPHGPHRRTAAELKLIRAMRRRKPALGVAEPWHRLRKRGYARRGVRVECVQADSGLEFTVRCSNGKRNLPALSEAAAAALGIRHKRIRPHPATAARRSAAAGRTRRAFTPAAAFIPWTALPSALPSATAAPTASPCGR